MGLVPHCSRQQLNSRTLCVCAPLRDGYGGIHTWNRRLFEPFPDSGAKVAVAVHTKVSDGSLVFSHSCLKQLRSQVSLPSQPSAADLEVFRATLYVPVEGAVVVGSHSNPRSSYVEVPSTSGGNFVPPLGTTVEADCLAYSTAVASIRGWSFIPPLGIPDIFTGGGFLLTPGAVRARQNVLYILQQWLLSRGDFLPPGITVLSMSGGNFGPPLAPWSRLIVLHIPQRWLLAEVGILYQLKAPRIFLREVGILYLHWAVRQLLLSIPGLFTFAECCAYIMCFKQYERWEFCTTSRHCPGFYERCEFCTAYWHHRIFYGSFLLGAFTDICGVVFRDFTPFPYRNGAHGSPQAHTQRMKCFHSRDPSKRFLAHSQKNSGIL